MKLILARHGNTFSAGDKVVMAGLTNDLPLVERGEEQAREVAEGLRRLGVKPKAVYCSALQRTRKGCEIVMEELNLSGRPVEDVRLNELDYGAWTGLADSEIEARFGPESRLAWQRDSVWPSVAGWGGSPEETTARVQTFAADLAQRYKPGDVVFATTHGGVLRYFLHLVAGEWDARHDDQTLKVKTGHLCGFTYHNGTWRLDFWNLNPINIKDEEIV